MNQACASLYYWNGQDMYIGKFPNNTEHQHHVIQIEIGVTAPFRLQVDGSNYDFRAVIIAPNVPHKVDDHDEWQLMLHIEPYSLLCRQLLATYLKEMIRTLFQMASDMTITIEEMVFENNVLCFRHVLRGVGTQDEMMGMAMVKFKDGKVSERWSLNEAQ